MTLNRCPVFVSSATFCGMPYELMFRLARQYGFDGVEVLLTRHAMKSFTRLAALASYDVKLTFHRWWGGPGLSGRLLPLLRIFPRARMRLLDMVPSSFPLPVVVSSYCWAERYDLTNILIQPAATGYGWAALPFAELKERMRKDGTRIAFNVMHWLKYRYGLTGMPVEPRVLLAAAYEDFVAWQKQIDEIHIYDFVPERVTGFWRGVSGVNLFPGDGIFPVERFLTALSGTRWRGRIVWEIHPLVIAPRLWQIKRLATLPALVRKVGL